MKWMGYVVLGSAVLAGCGGAAPAAPTKPPDPAPVTPPPAPAPTSWAIRGQVVGAPEGPPIAGATLTMESAAPVTADAAGNFAIVTTDSATRPLIISAPGFLARETTLTGGQERSGVLFDLIGSGPAFPLAQYRMMARDAYESPTNLQPTRRWTSPPNVYISTIWRETGLPVNTAGLEFLIAEIRRVIPQLTGGRLQVGLIETGAGTRPLTKGWIHVEFGRSGNWSRLGESPGQIQFGGDGTCNSLAIVHEFGHAMGYYHSNVKPSIMGGGPAMCVPFDFTPDEQRIARVMYSREPGNLEPDRDGPEPPPPIYHIGGLALQPPRFARDCDLLFRR